MSAPIKVRSGAPVGLDPSEFAEIYSLQQSAATLRPREALQPEEAALSLPPPEPADPKIALLNRALGPRLTTDNPLWSGNPVPSLRALQKSLIAHSLTLPQAQRRACLDALTVVERAILLRLRWQQMRRSELESALAEAPAPQPQSGAGRGGEPANQPANRTACEHTNQDSLDDNTEHEHATPLSA